MSLAIERLTGAHEAGYVDLLARTPEAMIYHSLRYRDFLARVLRSSEERYLVALLGSRVVGAMPAFLMRHAGYGNVLNSLPFFGSHGGPIVAPEVANRDEVFGALVEAFLEVARSSQAMASTVIANVLVPAETAYRDAVRPTDEDVRIGQLTPLPARVESLFDGLAPKTRSSLRKAMREGFDVGHDGSAETLAALVSLHTANMAAIGGRAKAPEVFAALADSFDYGTDYRIFTARREGRIVSALLVLQFKSICEYFTPATDAAYRALEPGRLLVLRAMEDAIARGCDVWNWGGTWPSQKNVHLFKSRWGTRDVPYRYFVRVNPESALARLSPEIIAAEYPYFYVRPFR
jgi:hypothetical protein